MAYKVIILYRLYMPSYFLGTFTEYPEISVIYFLDTDDADDADFFNIPIRVIRV